MTKELDAALQAVRDMDDGAEVANDDARVRAISLLVGRRTMKASCAETGIQRSMVRRWIAKIAEQAP